MVTSPRIGVALAALLACSMAVTASTPAMSSENTVSSPTRNSPSQSPEKSSESEASMPEPAAQQTFRNPLNASADPTMVYHDGAYYLATTQGDRLRMWRSESIATLLNAPAQDVWVDDDPSRNQQMWAPGLYRFDGRWYIYYTASDGTDANHRMYVVRSQGEDPMGPYEFAGQVVPAAEYAIDGEPFRHNGQLYFAWSSPGRGMGGPAQIYVAPMSDPTRISGDRIAVPVDGGCEEVREGPTFLYRNGRTFMTYSSCDTGKPDYQLWMTSIQDGADPMNPDAWTQHPEPVFSRNDDAGVWGPGHHFFFESPDGTEDWIAYHAKNTSDYDYSSRNTRAQKFEWNADGTPNFGQPLSLDTEIPLPSGDPGPVPTPINDTDAAVTYQGNWNSGSGCGNQCFRGDDHWSGEAGATATIRFTGSQVALLSVRDVGNGIAAISIDGGPEQRVDYYGDPRSGQDVHYVSPKLDSGEHTLTVRVTGEHHPDSSSAVISMDRIEVWP